MNLKYAVCQNDEGTTVSELQSIPEDYSIISARGIRTKSLYGRTSEQLKLLIAYHEVILKHQAKKVMIHGESGSGKTALVNSIQETVIQNGAYFVTGKFFQGSDLQEPHSAIVSAFSDVCDLVAQSKDLTENDLIKIKEELRSDSHILKRFITNVSPFLHNDTSDLVAGNDSIDYHKDSRISQFKIACKTFLRAMASKKHPIVMFIDDIQWMDDGSKEIIHMLLHDENLKHVLIILSYRDEEKPEVIGLAQSSGISHLVDISVENLDFSSVHHIVTEVLGANSTEIRGLSEVVMKKSSGNPLHVILFLETIQRQKLIVQEDDSYFWTFDINRIQDSVSISGSFTDLLSRKIALASSEAVEVLKVASLIGFSFEESFLVTVFQKLNPQNLNLTSVMNPDKKSTAITLVHHSLHESVHLGFLWKPSEELYQFSHDKIQSALQALSHKTDTSRFHASIGDVYFEQGCDGLSMYNTAVHWNAALGNLNGRYKRPKLARINLEAAKYCHNKAAFARGATLLHKALALFEPHEIWKSQHFKLTYEIIEMLAKMELIIGNFAACKKVTESVILQDIPVEKKISFLVLGIEAQITAFESEEAGEATVNALQILGLNIPWKVSSFHLIWSLCKIKLLLSNKTEHEILSLPMMCDKKMAAAVRILVLMCSCSIRMNKLPSAIFLAIQAIRLTILHGLSPYSAYALAMYGVAEVALQNYDKGYWLGCLAKKISTKLESKDALCGTMSFTLTFLSFWKDSLHNIQHELFQSGTKGFEVGDLMYATHCISQAFALQLFLGSNLKTVEESFRIFYDRTIEIRQNNMIFCLKPYLQAVLNHQIIRCDWSNLSVLSGEIMIEEEFLREINEAGHPNLKVTTQLLKAELAEAFEYFETAELLYKSIEQSGHLIRLTYGIVPWWECAGHTYYRMFLLSGRQVHLQMARMYRRRLEKLLAQGCQNAISSVAYLHVTEASVCGRVSNKKLLEIFSRQILIVCNFDNIKIEAKVNEEAGFACLRRGLKCEAELFFQQALGIYEKIGALGKCHWLREKVLVC